MRPVTVFEVRLAVYSPKAVPLASMSVTESRSAVVAWAAADRDVQAAEKSGNRDEMRAAIGRRNEITEAAISEVNTTLAAVQVALDRPTE